jgi:imidazolonepropionase-like amidohydrolase
MGIGMKASLAAGLALAALWAMPASAETAKVVAVKAGRLIDVNAAVVRTDQVILIEGERIKAVGPAGSTPSPAGARVFDLSD